MELTSSQTIDIDQITISNHLKEIGIESLRKEIISGLTSEQKHISSKFFYDKKGSKLFEEITSLQEYYPTRTEKSILKSISSELMSDLKNIDIVELGSGDCSKISILLKSIRKENLQKIEYIPVDVSQSAIENSSEKLIQLFPDLTIHGLVADFINQINLIPNNRKSIIFFLGSTIGNFNKEIANKFLKDISENMNIGDSFVMGLDLVKPIDVLHNAYNDSKGITAKFNKNILHVINGIIQSNFKLEDFQHQAFFNKEESRIEMHLVAKKNINIESPFIDKSVHIKKGENIHTENSYKFSLQEIKKLEETTDLKMNKIYTDTNNWFALVHFKK